MKNRVGEENINNQGEKMTIIAYRGAKDIDVQFEDGIIVYNRDYTNFKKGKIKNTVKYSIAYKYPKIAKMIAIEKNNLTFEDCYNISCHTHKCFYFKCPNCDTISNKKLLLSNIITKGYSCKKCSDGISMPNKFMSSLLNQLNINFTSEYSPCYFRNTQSIDFLLIDYNVIIEMDGNYGNHTKEYDYWRDFLNMKYGGYKTIRIDLTDSNKYINNTFNYIKEQIINSELYSIINLHKINWELIWEQSQKSKVIECWELWNNGIHDVNKIAKILNINRNTVTIYLKRGAECNKCNYSKCITRKVGEEKRKGNGSKKVTCITTGRSFNSISEAERYYNVKSISKCCRGKRNYAGKLNGIPLVWKYYE